MGVPANLEISEEKGPFSLRFLDFRGALRTLRTKAKKAEKGQKRPIVAADSQEGRPDIAGTPLSPHLLHPRLRQPKSKVVT